jgi:hypothetical protein
VATITEWLASLGMSEYAQRFADNRIDDVSILRDLTDQDLNGIGVPLGHRRKMLRAIGEMVGAAPTQMQPAPEPTPPDDAERRQLTVVFTDLVGSTALSTKLRWPSHAPSRQNPGSCALQHPWRGCGATGASGGRPAICLPPSMAGLAKVLTRST